MTIVTDIYRESGDNIDNLDVVLAKNAAELLHKHYEGHLWAVYVNSKKTGGVMVIKNLMVSGLYGYVLHLTTVYADPTLRCVVKAGGEILERAGLARGKNQFIRPTFVEGIPEKKQPNRWIKNATPQLILPAGGIHGTP